MACRGRSRPGTSPSAWTSATAGAAAATCSPTPPGAGRPCGRLGFGHDATDDKPYPETLYADTLRRRNDADWAFVVYVVDSLKDGDGMFRNGAVAYTADLFGPYAVLSYDNNGYGFDSFDAVLAHEMGHVFGALDEYAPVERRVSEYRRPDLRLPGRAQPQCRQRRHHELPLHHARVRRDA